MMSEPHADGLRRVFAALLASQRPDYVGARSTAYAMVLCQDVMVALQLGIALDLSLDAVLTEFLVAMAHRDDADEVKH